MIKGFVNAACEAVVALSVQGPQGRTVQVEAVVDTGYSGFLTLPAALATELGLEFACIGRALLANDLAVSFDVYNAIVFWQGQRRHIEADAMGTTPLLGMRLLERHSLSIEVENGGRVLIEARE